MARLLKAADRFARDLMVQLAGHDMLKGGVSLIAASAPTFFLEDTPTAVLVRQVLGAIAQFEKAGLVAKLAAARSGSASQMANARAERASPRRTARRSHWPHEPCACPGRVRAE